ncbi:amidase [Rhodoplanes sp. TEM]|uniref:Indoleacetamide hydrolase n=1 Tax=Rhodoplanes tepidamans TaxID=200616 RepID=A0ABT5JEC3_RHOTP|nr:MULTISPECIES: amidase [Rhodoplanes]MDC7787430.1 amidase [Rhodoplanes tepidamans]MDC7987691.1 amidase [Rhodoplanes sp. TEM]MDQ0358084.1 aspartyl-tRNA(Asn)/glutamyl-tRNA(Gln) amidotransferase subunit A [Rhodoplanes tepidamans]
MGTTRRFADWESRDEAQRRAGPALAHEAIATLGRRLGAVVAAMPAAPAVDGPLAGLTVAAKDMIATGVHAPSWGRATPCTGLAPRAAVLRRLDAAGAVLVATAEMTELAYEPSGHNASRGRVLNPWDFDRIVGGSSSGSAALVAAGCCDVALGSDTGGSVRIPAACCGVTALKPTHGTLPLDGVMPLAPSLDTVGVLARSAADLSRVWPVLSGTAPEAAALPRRAVVLDDALDESEPAVARACEEAIDAIAALAVAVTSRPGFPETADRHVLALMQAEAARTHAALIDDPGTEPVLRRRLAKGLAIDDRALADSRAARAPLREAFLAAMLGGADVAILPVMPIATPRVAGVTPGDPAFDPKRLYALSRFTRFVNHLGLPALALPAGFDPAGLPVGLQLVGRPGAEAQLLALGRAVQARTGWHGRVPRAVADTITTGWAA